MDFYRNCIKTFVRYNHKCFYISCKVLLSLIKLHSLIFRLLQIDWIISSWSRQSFLSFKTCALLIIQPSSITQFAFCLLRQPPPPQPVLFSCNQSLAHIKPFYSNITGRPSGRVSRNPLGNTGHHCLYPADLISPHREIIAVWFGLAKIFTSGTSIFQYPL